MKNVLMKKYIALRGINTESSKTQKYQTFSMKH